MREPAISERMSSRGARKLILALLVILAGCAVLPRRPPAVSMLSLPASETGPLANIHNEIIAVRGEDASAFLPLVSARDAMLFRLLLIDEATTSIDLQYFIWSSDEAGRLLLSRLFAAARRGVRVRLLVDNIFLQGSNRTLASLGYEPNFLLKVYNPNRIRESWLGSLGEFILNFGELNRRMHNKVMVVDGHVAIAGGRNIGNAYFGLSEEYNFRDLDALIVGPIVPEVAEAFDEYWNAEIAYPAESMSSRAEPEDLEAYLEGLHDFLEERSSRLASYTEREARDLLDLDDLRQRFEKGRGYFLQDTPVELEGERVRLVDLIGFAASETTEELLVVSPYLIPRGRFLESIASLVAKGIEVNILTGSLGANNHTLAHAHYRKYRRALLGTGASLYEFRHDPSPAIRSITDVPPVEAGFVSLHTKLLVSDRSECFVGSLNLDPRAVEINTENGVLVVSEPFCGLLATHVEMLLEPENAWGVELDDRGSIRWRSGDTILSRQPARRMSQRIADFFYRWLPVESQI
jgi:cardiolipin synthase C